MKQSIKISRNRIARIRTQGYYDYDNFEITNLAFGNRFAYIICTLLLLYGVLDKNLIVLLIMLFIAILGVVLPRHPFDYIYNTFLAKRMNKPILPKRSLQLKFACAIASLCIAFTLYFFSVDNFVGGYISGTVVLVSALLVSITDICIPSIIYNSLLNKEN